jgi:hypothetical protein
MAVEVSRSRPRLAAPVAVRLLQVGYLVVLTVAGADKFLHFLVNWDIYLTSLVPLRLGIDGHAFMLGVGVLELAIAGAVAFVPRIGGLAAGLWFSAIVVNLLTIPAYLDVALMDAGLACGALALAAASGGRGAD